MSTKVVGKNLRKRPLCTYPTSFRASRRVRAKKLGLKQFSFDHVTALVLRCSLSVWLFRSNAFLMTRVSYNCGAKPRDATLVEGGPAAYFTGLPIRELLGKLRAGGVPAEISNSAGAFGCNQIFYHLMDYATRERLDILAGFIHVPKLPEQVVDTKEPHMALDLIASGLEIVVEEISEKL